MRAKDFELLLGKALVNWGAPTLNQVYADKNGNIGWMPGGLAPKRPNWDGLLPVPGDGRYEWDGFWRGDKMPSIYNPEKGWIATANAYNIPEEYPAIERKLGFEWTKSLASLAGARSAGNALPKVSLEDLQRLAERYSLHPGTAARRTARDAFIRGRENESRARIFARMGRAYTGWIHRKLRWRKSGSCVICTRFSMRRSLKPGSRVSTIRHRHERDAGGHGEARDPIR